VNVSINIIVAFAGICLIDLCYIFGSVSVRHVKSIVNSLDGIPKLMNVMYKKCEMQRPTLIYNLIL
jgi:hypothetical protein